MYYKGSFDRSVDVVVIGFGAAGAVAAMTACDAGAEVLMIEKQREDKRRPNSIHAGSFLVPKDPATAVHYMTQLNRRAGEVDEIDPAVIRTWAEETARNPEWIRTQGGDSAQVFHHGEHRDIEGNETIKVYRPHERMFKFLSNQVGARQIGIIYDAEARWLLTDSSGAVVGVRVATPGRELNIQAARGVVMTCGGFEFNEWLKLNYLRVYPTYFFGNPENTGDGIRMAIDVGADLWHMNACSGQLVAWLPSSGWEGGVELDQWGVAVAWWGVEGVRDAQVLQGELEQTHDGDAPVAPPTHLQLRVGELPGLLFTDRYGRRFTNELYRLHHLYYELTTFDSHKLSYPRVPSWWIFDERRRSMGPVVPTNRGPAGPVQELSWSKDNLQEIEKGWIISATTVAELGEKCGMKPSDLVETVAQYNSYCSAGEDPDYGRPALSLTALDSPPFYAIKCWPGGSNTQGGPRRDAEARVIRVTGEPVPHLYSAGEFGSVYGMLYPQSGGQISECLAFGRIAGREVAAIKTH